MFGSCLVVSFRDQARSGSDVALRHGNIEESVAVACAEVFQKLVVRKVLPKVWRQETIQLPTTVVFQMDLAAENPEQTIGWQHQILPASYIVLPSSDKSNVVGCGRRIFQMLKCTPF